jgi:hypothetical protein
VKFEAAVSVAPRASITTPQTLIKAHLAIYYCCGDNIRVIWVNTADGDRFALKVNITIAKAGVSTRLNLDCVAIVSIVYSCLDVIKIRWAIVIDRDYPGLAGAAQEHAGKDKKHFVHIGTLRKGFISGNILLQK